MVKRSSFERGDIVTLCLNPTAGNEIQGEKRPALVLSTSDFNRLGMVLVAPITQGGNYARDKGFAVTLSGAGTQTQGVVLVNQIKMLDLMARQAKRLEKAPEEVITDALARLQTIIE
jgi:mRNA interferase ChpB